MNPEQPNTPSTDVASDASAPATGSEQASSEQPSRGWWSRLFSRGTPSEEEQPEAQDQEQAPGGPGAAKTLTLTEEELERRVQAETDRRESKRAQDAKTQRRRELRKNDPWAYAEEDEKADQEQEGTQQIEQFFANIGTEHDKVSIDPLVHALPQAERERILKLEGAGRGLDGRRLIVTEGLKALEKHWRAEAEKEAEAKLRRNPAFRKQLLAELRGQTVEPELIPAQRASAADQTVSALLRDHYRLG